MIEAFCQPPSCDAVSYVRLNLLFAFHTVVFFLCDQDHFIFAQAELTTRLASKVIESLELRVLWRRRRGSRKRRWWRWRYAR